MMEAAAKALTPVASRQTLRRIVDRISSVDGSDFAQLSAADDITVLSANTQFESIGVSPEAVFIAGDGDEFEASAVVYVTLNYGGKRDAVSMPDSYPAVVKGKIVDGNAEVDSISVDTSGFYE